MNSQPAIQIPDLSLFISHSTYCKQLGGAKEASLGQGEQQHYRRTSVDDQDLAQERPKEQRAGQSPRL
jgi:hypothetical protein